MDTMRTKFVIAVTGRLSAAADSDAKVELIEELSENLYSRWQDLVAGGMSENEAFSKAMEDLGNVDELLAYLDSLGPEGELPKQGGGKDFAGDLFKGVEDVVRETVNQTKDAMDQAKNILKDVEQKLKERYPDGFKGKVYVRFDGDEDIAAREAEQTTRDTEAADAAQAAEDAEKEKGWSFSVGYNKNRGGFFCENSRVRKVEGTALPSQLLKGIDVQINGDVDIQLDSDPDSDVVLDGDVENLEMRVSDDGVLSIRQGSTATSSFFFLRGLASADVKLTLPRRFWDFLQISTVSGDVEVDEGLEVGQLSVKTASGDTRLQGLEFQQLILKTASGDLETDVLSGRAVQANSASGDIQLTGCFDSVQVNTASGEIELEGSVREARCHTASGDVELRVDQVPEILEMSSKSGDCEIAMPGGEGFTLQFSTVSGELDSDFQLVGPIGKRSGEAIYLDGGGRTFKMSSISGDLTLRQN
ncbi:MAG: DUF4097 domain-containing protein [Oscillospiraceae bacterium]|nr:DUF4097 domain-containing protein [Oscillospiraceae bacterium]